LLFFPGIESSISPCPLMRFVTASLVAYIDTLADA
jgi:hypothetical protein